MILLTCYPCVLLGYITLVRTVRTFYPASVPLSVRSPYLNVWQDWTTDADRPAPFNYPLTWTQDSNAHMSWTGKIRIDGSTYDWLGVDRPSTALVTDVRITPTRSLYTMQIGPMTLNATFLSPVEPVDWVKQSIPFSYLSVDVSADDGAEHDVQLYSDITAEWVSGDRSSLIQYNFTTTNHSWYHTIALQNPTAYREVAEQADDGQSYHVMGLDHGAAASWQIDDSASTRLQFINEGELNNMADTTFKAIQVQEHSWPVYAFSVDLGHIQATTSPVTWAVGFVRNPTIRYTTPAGDIQDRRPYFVTQFSDISTMIDSVTSDFSAAYDRAVALDAKIIGDAANISNEYVDLVSLTTRQTLGTLDITVSMDSNETVDPSDILIFMKDIGTSQRVNPVEHIFAALPAFLYLNASLVGAIIKPLLIAQEGSGTPGQAYAARDIGTLYPNATVDNGPHNQGVEQSGNMLIIMYAHAKFSGDRALLSTYYNLTKRWADYLVNTTLALDDQVSADNETSTTNLAVKGIIGVKSMAEIARTIGEELDAQRYDGHAHTLMNQWLSLAQSTSYSKHVLGQYGNEASWSMLYNAYADILLRTGLIPQTTLEYQTSLYNTLLATALPLGLPIDSSVGKKASTAWTLLTSATVTDNLVRDQLLAHVWARASDNTTTGVFPDVYNITSGNSISGGAGPAAGSMYAHLALTLLVSSDDGQSTPGPKMSTASHPSRVSRVGVIAGVTIGASLSGILGVALFKFWRKRHPPRAANATTDRDLVADLISTPVERNPRHQYASGLPVPAQRSDIRESGQVMESQTGSHSSRESARTDLSWQTDLHALRAELDQLRQALRERHELPPVYESLYAPPVYERL